MKLEICIDNLESAMIATKCGADRLELCEDLSVGGLTPSIELIDDVKKISSIPIFVMIRPRPGDYNYDESEQENMLKAIEKRKDKVDGFVLGALDKDNNIDIAVCKRLIAACSGLPVTFHRAFDDIDDKKKALDNLITLGFKRLLTSGGPEKAENGIKEIRAFMCQAGSRIVIMPGGGITAENISFILENTKATEYHSSGRARDYNTHNLKSKVCSVKAIQNMSRILKMASARRILELAAM